MSVTLSLGRVHQQEAMFGMAVRQDVYEERQNQLRWQVKLGDDQITPDKRAAITTARSEGWRDYKVMGVH